MTTGQSDVLVVPREPAASVGNGPIIREPASDREKPSDSTTGTTRSRKKVTFDLDLQVRTIPNRIPMYERRPAHYNNTGHLSRGRSSQSYAFGPKPLDIRGRDRYLIGAANLSAKKIVDLFRVPNGHQSYPSPPKGQARQGQPAWRRQSQQGYGSAATSGSSAVRHPAYAYDGTKSAKMSRAAANLKQITAALSEHFDASVYQEWNSSEKKKGPTPVSASIQGISSSDVSAGSGSCNTVSPTPPRGFNPTKLKNHLHYRQQLSPQSISPTDSNQDSESSRTSLAERSRTVSYSSGTATSTSTRKLPVVVMQQSSLSDPQLIISKAPSNSRPDVRRRSDDGVYQGSERFRRVPSARTDRSASRCSSIDSFVISEPFDLESGPSGASYTKEGRFGSGRKMPPAQGAGRPMAWEGAEISVTEPNLMANALRTVKQGQNMPLNNPLWQVSSKPLNR